MPPKMTAYYIPNFKTTIPTSLESFVTGQNIFKKIKSLLKMYKRYLFIKFSEQEKLICPTICANTKRILWINCSSTSIGDSIMELSGRVLLSGKFIIDLLTNKKNAPLYTEDSIFQNIYTHIDDLDPQNYDFILLDINNSKSLHLKIKYFKHIKYAELQGFFYGLDFNRMLFSYHRINALLNYPYTQEQLDHLAKNFLYLLPEAPTFSKNKKRIVIAVGGEDQIRSYTFWGEVIIAILQLFPSCTISLVGSQNGLTSVKQIQAKLQQQYKDGISGQILEIKTLTSNSKINDQSNKFPVTNYVAQLSLLETARLISNSDIFIGADGGLMHIAEAFNLAGVALFTKFNPKYRLGYNSQLETISAKNDVSSIPPEKIINKLRTICCQS